MNFMSLNIRGIGEAAKARWVRKLVATHKISFLCIQETQIADGSKVRCNNFWKSDDFEAEVTDAVGRSGGLMCIWNKNVFNKQFVIKNRYYMVVSGIIKGSNQFINIVNIHGPRNLQDRRVIWEELVGVKEAGQGMWLMIGDFNAVRFQEDRLNTGFDQGCANALNNFVSEAGLYEFAMRGQKYTFCKSKSRKLSKIDRCFVSQEFLDLWADSCFMALPRYL